MAKPPKPNTVVEVSRRVAKLADTLRTIDEVTLKEGVEGGSQQPSLIYTASFALSHMFDAYGIALPTLDQTEAAIRSGLERAILPSERVKLGAVEGVSRLLSKLALLTYEQQGYDPRAYITDLVQVLAGLPLEQLSSTPDRSRTGFDELTIRDMVSDLVSADRMRSYEHPFMLHLIQPDNVGMLTRHSGKGGEIYAAFLRRALSYVNLLNAHNQQLSYAELEMEIAEISVETERGLERASAAVNGSGSGGKSGLIVIIPSELEGMCRGPDFRGALEAYLGGSVVALSLQGGRNGRKPTVVFHYVTGGTRGRATVGYNTSVAPLSVVDALLAIQQECNGRLKPSDPLYLPNSGAGTGLPFLAAK